MAVQKQDDQHERTFSSYVRIRDVVLKTYLGQWTIGRSGERGSGISVLPARYDDDLLYNRDVILPLDNILKPRRIYYGDEYHQIALKELHRSFILVRNNIKKQGEPR